MKINKRNMTNEYVDEEIKRKES